MEVGVWATEADLTPHKPDTCVSAKINIHSVIARRRTGLYEGQFGCRRGDLSGVLGESFQGDCFVVRTPKPALRIPGSSQ